MSKTYFIAGANGGTGQQLAKSLKSQGHTVIGSARDISKLDYDLDEKVELDVMDQGSIEQAVEKINEFEINGFAYCIGSIDMMPFKKAPLDKFKASFDLNVLGVVSIMQGIVDNLKKNKGAVVLFSTIAARSGFANHTVVSTAKGAVEALGISLAADFAPDIRVNVIAPSLSDTPLAKMITSSEQMASSIAKMHPIPRLGTSKDLADMAEFLLSEKSDWMTGQVLHLDGGRSTLRTKG